MNALGYQKISASQFDEAIALFVFNTQQYPEDWNGYDSLGEAYADGGHIDLAVANYQRSLALNPKNAGAAKALRKLLASR